VIRRAEIIADGKRNYVWHQRLAVIVSSAQSRQELREAAEFAEEHLELVDPQALALADQAFGRLRGKLARDYDLPTPDWAPSRLGRDLDAHPPRQPLTNQSRRPRRLVDELLH